MPARSTGWVLVGLVVMGLAIPGAGFAASRGRDRYGGDYNEGNTGAYSYYQHTTRRPYSDAANDHGRGRRSQHSIDDELGGVCPRCGRRHSESRWSSYESRDQDSRNYRNSRERYTESDDSRPDSYGPDRVSEREGGGRRRGGRYSREEDYAPVSREREGGRNSGRRPSYAGRIADYEGDEAPRRGRNRVMREYDAEPGGDRYARRGFRSDRVRGERY
jgi:hypothetical protein